MKTVQNTVDTAVVRRVVAYARAMTKWVSEKGLRSVTDYLKLDGRNPLIQRLGKFFSERFNTGHNLSG